MSQISSRRSGRKAAKKAGRIGGVIFGGIFVLIGIFAFFGILFDDDIEGWDLVQIMVAFILLLLFSVAGGSVIWYSLRRSDVAKRLAEVSQSGIFSDQKSSHRGFFIAAGIFTFPGVVIAITGMLEGRLFGLLSLLFFLLSYVLYAFGRKSKNTYAAIGPTPIQLDPAAAVVGHQFGGSFPLQAKPRTGLTLRLSCLHTYSSGSGDNRTTHTDVLHQQETKGFIDTTATGQQRVKFLFDIPADAPGSDSDEYRGSIRWQLKATGQVTTDRKVPGTQIAELMEFSRSWDIPLLSLALARELDLEMQTSQLDIPQQHQEVVQREQQQEAQQSAERQIDMETELDGSISVISEAGRNKGMWGMLLLFGLIFGSVGLFLFKQALSEGGGLWLMAPVFTCVGWGIFFFGIFLSGRRLETSVREGHVQVIRSLFGRQLYQRNGKITSPSQLQLKMTMSSTSQDHVKTEYMAIYAKLDGKNIKLVEGIEGRRAGEAMMEKIKAALTTRLDEELA